MCVVDVDTNGDNQLDESELEALFQKEVSVVLVVCVCVCNCIVIQLIIHQSGNLLSVQQLSVCVCVCVCVCVPAGQGV